MPASPVITASIPRESYVWLGNVFLPLAADIGMSMRTNPPIGVSKGKRATASPQTQVTDIKAEWSALWAQSVIRQSVASTVGQRSFGVKPQKGVQHSRTENIGLSGSSMAFDLGSSSPRRSTLARAADQPTARLSPPWVMPATEDQKTNHARPNQRKPLFTMGTESQSPSQTAAEAPSPRKPLFTMGPPPCHASQPSTGEAAQRKPLFVLTTPCCTATDQCQPEHSHPGSLHAERRAHELHAPWAAAAQYSRPVEMLESAQQPCCAEQSLPVPETSGQECEPAFLPSSVDCGRKIHADGISPALRCKTPVSPKHLQNPYGREVAPVFAPVRSMSLPAEGPATPEAGSGPAHCLRTAKSLPPKPYLTQGQSLLKEYMPVLVEALLELTAEAGGEVVSNGANCQAEVTWTPDLDFGIPGGLPQRAAGLNHKAPSPRPRANRLQAHGRYGGCVLDYQQDSECEDFHDALLDDLVGW
eukprot:jgi/Botrbrau1/14432/Bobra.0014s0078.1